MKSSKTAATDTRNRGHASSRKDKHVGVFLVRGTVLQHTRRNNRSAFRCFSRYRIQKGVFPGRFQGKTSIKRDCVITRTSPTRNDLENGAKRNGTRSGTWNIALPPPVHRPNCVVDQNSACARTPCVAFFNRVRCPAVCSNDVVYSAAAGVCSKLVLFSSGRSNLPPARRSYKGARCASPLTATWCPTVNYVPPNGNWMCRLNVTL